MKSEIEIQTALSGLVLLNSMAMTKASRDRALHCADMLLWVMEYPNGFDKIYTSIKALNLPMEAIDKDIKKLVADYKPPEDPDAHTE